MFKRTSLNRLRGVPTSSSRKSEPISNDFRLGMVTFPPNDIRPIGSLQLLQDTRIASIGHYKTRQGCDFYSVPIGEAVNVQVTSTTGAADQTISISTWRAEKLTATTSGRLSMADVRLKNDAAASGTIMVAVYSDDSGTPDELLALSSISAATITSSYAYVSARFIEAPTITSGSDYWVVVYLQESGTGSYKISSTTNSTNAKVSTNAGQTWSASTFSLNVKLYTATSGGVKGEPYRAYKSDGTTATFFAHGTTLYMVNDLDGTTTAVDTGLSALSEEVTYEFVNDILYYTDGIQKPRKYNFTTASEVATATGNVRGVIEHVNHLFYLDADDQNKVIWTDLADFEVFPSTNYRYVPASKKSDKLTAMAKLNGMLYFYTRLNKYSHYGQDNATFSVDEAPAQKGTFSQKSIIWDDNYIYFASDDGIYQFNGTSEDNLTFNNGNGIQDIYESIPLKDNIALELHNNRLYVWYTESGGDNNQCLVYNLLYRMWESIDTKTYIGGAFARKDTSNLFIQASNRIGVVYYGEKSTNDYTNLGEIMRTELKTNYDPMGAAQKLKRVTAWRPDFRSTAGSYSAQAGYAQDYSDDVTFYDVPLQSSGYRYDAADALYDSATYAGSGEVHITTLEMAGEAYRWQRVYKHHAAREPIEFTGETLAIQTQRMR